MSVVLLLISYLIPQQCLIHLFLSQCHVSQPAWKLLYDATQTLLQWHGRGPAELSYILQWVLQQMAVTGLSVTTLWPSVIWVSCSVGRPTMLACSARMSPVPVWRATKLTYEQVSKAAEAQTWTQCNSLWLYTIYIQMAGLIIYLSSLTILKTTCVSATLSALSTTECGCWCTMRSRFHGCVLVPQPWCPVLPRGCSEQHWGETLL